MRTDRQSLTLILISTLLVGPGGTMLVAQAPPAAGSQAAAPAAAPAATASAPAAAEPTDGSFSKEQLEQLVAPIALYPDSLLAQIFMASTYPIEIVQAERFMTANPTLKGAELDTKLKDYDWQDAVKSMCSMPEVLTKLSQNLDWTQDLGDAFLGQKGELMDTVQVMRNKAYASGNLKSTEQQTVKVENNVQVQTTGAAPAAAPASAPQIIVIESSDPEIVYVPQYSPTVVYGGWSYPSYYYPPMYPYYPPGAGLVTFGVGMAVGAAIWGNCNWGGGWGHGDVDIDINRNTNFNRNTSINGGNRATTTGNRGGKQSFQHNPAGRKGVNYQNGKVANQYGGKSGTNRASKGQGTASAQARGRSASTASAGSRQARTPSASTQGAQGRSGQAGSGQGAAARDRQGSGAQGGGDRAASAKASGAGQRASGSKASTYSGSGSGRSAYGGSSSPSTSRAASSRGSSSRGSMSYGGGGSRGGGGMRGGGGGRRR